MAAKGTLLEEIGSLCTGTKIHLFEFWRYMDEFWHHIFEFWNKNLIFGKVSIISFYDTDVGGGVGSSRTGGTFQPRCGQKRLRHPLVDISGKRYRCISTLRAPLC